MSAQTPLRQQDVRTHPRAVPPMTLRPLADRSRAGGQGAALRLAVGAFLAGWLLARRSTGRAATASAPARAEEPGTATAPPLARGGIVWRTYCEFVDDRIMATAAGITFYALLALFPAIATLVSLYGLIADPATIQTHLSLLSGIAPGGAIDIIGAQLQRLSAKGGSTLGLGFAIGMVTSLWSANAGIKSMLDGLNIAFEQKETRSFVKFTLVSFAFTIGAIVLLLLALGIIVVVPMALHLFGLESATDRLFAALRWPALMIVIIVALGLLYRYGPSRTLARWRWITWGSGLAAVGWLALSAAFSWYTANFGTYDETYGSLGAAIGFMTWIWLSVTVILLGAELDSERARREAARAAAYDGAAGRPISG